MKILFLTSGRRVPCSRFRVLQYIPYLEAQGHECTVSPSLPAKYKGLPLLGNRLSEIPRTVFRLWDCLRAWWNRYDVVLIERELFSSGFFAIERMLRRLVPAIVLDVDDGIFLLHPKKFDALTAMADAVIVGNSLLQAKAQPLNSNTTVIPTSLDMARYTPKDVDSLPDRMILGWTGVADNLKYLLAIAVPLQQLARKHDFELRIIAERPPSQDLVAALAGVKMTFVRWQEESEIDELKRFDIGLMPLDDSQWNRYKCGLKILQYMAVGIPAIASPVGVNADIIQTGQNGFLANDENEWTVAFEALISDATLRRSMGLAGRQTVELGYCVAKNVIELESVFRNVRKV